MTESEIKLQLAKKEDKEAAERAPSFHKVTPLSMLVELLDIKKL